MRKIPTLFVRDENDRRYVTPAVTPGCEWVIAGEGVATRKFDGTCVKIEREDMDVYGKADSDFAGEVIAIALLQRVFTRREIKPGGTIPDGFVHEETDPTTGKTVGWVPYEESGFGRYIDEALDAVDGLLPAGTYELCGPKINGNPEGFDSHVLIPHGSVRLPVGSCTYEALRDYLRQHPYEGIVWHHPDGRMAKLKRRDFPK